MDSFDLNERLQELTNEDYIWIIYLFIIIFSFYSNHLERNYFLYKDKLCKEKYRNINTVIFSILLLVYIYFLQNSVKSLMNLKDTDSKKKKDLVFLSFLASLLITISGFIFLYISFVDDNLDVEIAFN